MNSKIKDATEFLQMCKNLSSKTHVDKNVVYGLLEDYKVSESDLALRKTMHPLHYFDGWNNSLGPKNNLSVYHWRNYWTGFDNNVPRGSYIKIYLPLDSKHLFEGVKQVFSYLEKENISHTSKATSLARADNVIIRIDSNDIESLKKIYKFIKNNPYIQEGINQVNPFLPTVGKLGVMIDDGRSYNMQMSELIAIYINNYAKDSKIDFSNFAKFINEQKKSDPVFLETFKNAFFEKSQYQQTIESEEYSNRINIDIKTPLDFLEFAILLSFEKYGKQQAVRAIKNALEGNYDYFSRIGYDRDGREVKVRESLPGIVSPQLLKGYILQNNLFTEESNIDNIITNYVDSVIYRHKGKILEDALYATAIKMFDNKAYVEKRIRDYSEKGDSCSFSRFNDSVRPNYNFRESVLQNISPSKTFSVIESILYNKGIKYTNKSQYDKVSDCSDIIINRVASRHI